MCKIKTKQVLLENFLGYCTNGIGIKLENKILKFPTIYIEEFEVMNNENEMDMFCIFDKNCEMEDVVIDLNKCDVMELDDCCEITSGDMKIVIEELV